MKLEDHVEKIRIKVEEAVKNTLDRCGITMNGNTYAQQKVNGISIGNVEQLVQSIQSENHLNCILFVKEQMIFR